MDDCAYVFINQHYVATQSIGTDSSFIDVTAYLQNGLNHFNFLIYNTVGTYSWGFQIMQNDDIVFDDTAGFVGSVGADNNNQSRTYQFVYNKTISINITKCASLTITSSTGEL